VSKLRQPEAAKGRPADSAYGRPSTTSGRPSRGRPAPGQMPTVESSRCSEMDAHFQCRASRAHRTPYCIGHLRQHEKLGEVFDYEPTV
jgi:hypothetical protein